MINWSVEILPPRNKNKLIDFINISEGFLELEPDYISVTYGSNHQDGVLGAHILKFLEKDRNTEPLQHFTFINKEITEIDDLLIQAIQNGTKNILALRGDGENNGKTFFQSTSDFVRYIKQKYPELSVSVACFPEGNNEAPSINPIQNLLEKEKAGADFAIAQIDYSSQSVIGFIKDAQNAGVKLEIIPGLCPSYNKDRFEKIKKHIGVPVPKTITKELLTSNNFEKDIINFWKKFMDECISNNINSFHFYSFNEINPIKDLLKEYLTIS